MRLEHKITVIYGGAGVLGGAAALAFAREGAQLYLAGRNHAKLEHIARKIRAAGGAVEVAALDALDEAAVERHLTQVVARAGRVDVSLNAIAATSPAAAPPALLELSSDDDDTHPARTYAATHFLTGRAAARHMVRQRGGVIMTIAAGGAAGDGFAGAEVACAALEAVSSLLASEVAAHGVRVVCVRADGAGSVADLAEAAVRYASDGVTRGVVPARRQSPIANP